MILATTNRVTPESFVMRSVFNFQPIRSVEQIERMRAERIAADLPYVPVPTFDPLSLPIMQQIAMMTMHESPVHWSLVRRLQEQVQDKPSRYDYRTLAERGWCHKRPNDDWHRLTGEGAFIARELEQSLCKQFNIHIRMGGDTGVGATVRFHCPCGWQTSVPRNTSANSWGRTYFNNHVATANGLDGLREAMRPVGVEGT